MAKMLLVTAIKFGTINGPSGAILHVDPENDDAKVLRVSEADAEALIKAGLAKKGGRLAGDDDADDVDAAAAKRVENPAGNASDDAGSDTSAADTINTTAFPADSDAHSDTVGGDDEGADDDADDDADAPPPAPARRARRAPAQS